MYPKMKIAEEATGIVFIHVSRTYLLKDYFMTLIEAGASRGYG